MVQLKSFIATLENENRRGKVIIGTDNTLTAEMVGMVIYKSFSNPSSWTVVFEALRSAIDGKRKKLYDLAYHQENYHESMASFFTTFCADSKDSTDLTLEEWKSQIVQLQYSSFGAAANHFGAKLLAW